MDNELLARQLEKEFNELLDECMLLRRIPAITIRCERVEEHPLSDIEGLPQLDEYSCSIKGDYAGQGQFFFIAPAGLFPAGTELMLVPKPRKIQ